MGQLMTAFNKPEVVPQDEKEPKQVPQKQQLNEKEVKSCLKMICKDRKQETKECDKSAGAKGPTEAQPRRKRGKKRK
jgi:hypothetical protein